MWPLLYPLLLLGIYHLVFARFLKLKFGDGAAWLDGGYETTFYMLSGILPWLCFADTTARATNVGGRAGARPGRRCHCRDWPGSGRPSPRARRGLRPRAPR